MKYIIVFFIAFVVAAILIKPAEADDIYDWAMRESNKEQPYLPPDLLYDQILSDIDDQRHEHEMEHLRQESFDELNRDRGFDLDYHYDY